MKKIVLKYLGWSNPRNFMFFAQKIQFFCMGAAIFFFAAGCYTGLWASPADYQQGEIVRLMYVHVPSASLSLLFYSFMALASLVYFLARLPLADLAARCSAPIGAAVTGIALVTGSIWGKSSWGTSWVWDARLTSTLILFFLYISYISLSNLIADEQRAARIAAIFALIGFVDIPIIKFSVDWWYTLHQPASILRSDGISIAAEMLLPLGLMSVGLLFFFISMVLLEMQSKIMQKQIIRHNFGQKL